MKKIIALAMAAVFAAGMLVSCGKKFECEMCGQEKSGKSYEMMGSVICKDCYKGIEALGDLLG